MLKLSRSNEFLSLQISYYARGMSAQCISLENVIHWTILKVEFPSGIPHFKSLNLPFIRFQQRCRSYFQLLRRVRNTRFLLNREVGL